MGKYLFYLTKRDMSAAYSSLDDGTWIYPNSTQIASVALSKETPSLLSAKNDEVELKNDKDKKEADENGNGKKEEKTETKTNGDKKGRN